MHFARTVISAFGALALSTTAYAQSSPSLDGDWINVLTRFDNKQYQRMKLTRSGDTLRAEGTVLKLSGKISGKKVELEGKDDDGDAIKINGVLEGSEMRGTLVSKDATFDWLAYPTKPRPANPTTHTFEPKEFHRQFSGAIPPALHIHPGDTVKTWTVDAGGSDSHMKRLSAGGNPETGPFYIEDALPGDVISVKLNRVRLNRDSAFSGTRVVPSALNPGYYGSLQKENDKVKGISGEWVLDREHNVARLKKPTDKLKDYTIALRPMMGCIGVAPPANMALRSGYLGPFGGNMDYNEVREGATIYLPVFTPGALLFIGDGHAAQGDGELTGDALETSMDVEFTVDLIRNQGQSGPRMENADYIMASGIAGSLNDALQMATTEISRWLARDYDLNHAEVGLVLGSAMKYDIAEVVDPYVHVVAKVAKKSLAPLQKKK